MVCIRRYPPAVFLRGYLAQLAGHQGHQGEPFDGNHVLFSFLTTAPNAEVAPVHAKAMPVCLLTEAERETWMQGSIDDALALQRPAKDGALRVVARGAREDTACQPSTAAIPVAALRTCGKPVRCHRALSSRGAHRIHRTD
jgi:hypothetical protein